MTPKLMAARDHDEMLRELRCTTGFVLVRRRSAGSSRRGRTAMWRDRRGSPGAPWRDRGSPLAERSRAKGKRSRRQRAGGDDTQSVTSSCPSGQSTPTSQSPQRDPVCPCHRHLSPLSSPPSSRCSSTSSLASIGQEAQQQQPTVQSASKTPCGEEDGASVEYGLPWNFPLAPCPSSGRPRPSEKCTHSQLAQDTSQHLEGYAQCSCNSCAHRDLSKEDESLTQWVENETYPSRKRCHFRHCPDPEVDHFITRKSLWLDEAVYYTRGVYNSAPSHVCACSNRKGERLERDDCDSVCSSLDQADGVDRMTRKRTCIASKGLPIVHKECESSHTLNQLAAGSSDPQTSRQPCTSHSHTASPCQCCHQRRLLPSSKRGHYLHQRRGSFPPCPKSHEQLCSLLNRNDCQSRTESSAESGVNETSSGSWWSNWSRMLVMRYVGRCLLVLLLTGLGGLFAHVTIRDYNIAGQHGGVDVIGGFGGAFGIGGAHPANILMKMHMRPVPVREFHARLRTVRSKYDLLRIFLANKDISDDSLRHLLTAASSPDTLVHPAVSEYASASADTSAKSVSSDVKDDAPLESDSQVARLTKLLKPSSGESNIESGSSSDAILSELKAPGLTSDAQQSSEENTVLSNPINNKSPAKTDIVKSEETPKSNSDIAYAKKPSASNDIRISNVQKRAETLYDEYPAEDVNEGDYLDGEVEYYNDERHADALLEELEEAVYHIAEMENNPQAQCKDPQPQVVYIEDPKKLNRQFYPECTVIHRCRNDSGCCGSNYECGPKTERVVMQAFLVVNVDTVSDTVMPDSQMVERIALVNHTECQCREKKKLPDCTKACPEVFKMYRYGWQCVCDCVSNPNERFPQCEQIKDGLYPLSQDDLVCIKSGKCGLPKCSVGRFDVSSGFCPLKDAPHVSSDLQASIRHQYRLRHAQRRESVIEGSGDV